MPILTLRGRNSSFLAWLALARDDRAHDASPELAKSLEAPRLTHLIGVSAARIPIGNGIHATAHRRVGTALLGRRNAAQGCHDRHGRPVDRLDRCLIEASERRGWTVKAFYLPSAPRRLCPSPAGLMTADGQA
jgi:hypothetical protein